MDPTTRRFLTRVRKDQDGCWIWTGGTKTGGRGEFWYQRKNVLAYRFAYEWFRAPIPTGMVIDHLCKRPACVNPDHLEAVTQSVNVLRGDLADANRVRKATISQCPHGHEYIPENSFSWSDGRRRCRVCEIVKNEKRKRPRVPYAERITHCPRGHLYDEKNTAWFTNKNGYTCRSCRTCNRERARLNAARKQKP